MATIVRVRGKDSILPIASGMTLCAVDISCFRNEADVQLIGSTMQS